jgi:hypothetical protein
VRNIPGCTYCHPQVASVGLTEAKAKEQGYTVKVGRFPFIGNGKAIALGEAEGIIKTVFDAKTGELLGAHMVGAEVTETDPGLHHRQDAGDHRGRADAHGLPASDHERNDARERARCCFSGGAGDAVAVAGRVSRGSCAHRDDRYFPRVAGRSLAERCGVRVDRGRRNSPAGAPLAASSFPGLRQ